MVKRGHSCAVSLCLAPSKLGLFPGETRAITRWSWFLGNVSHVPDLIITKPILVAKPVRTSNTLCYAALLEVNTYASPKNDPVNERPNSFVTLDLILDSL